MDFDGYGIGGAPEKGNYGANDSVGQSNFCLKNKPRHLLGISEPDDIFAANWAGIGYLWLRESDVSARNGAAYTLPGSVQCAGQNIMRDVCADYGRDLRLLTLQELHGSLSLSSFCTLASRWLERCCQFIMSDLSLSWLDDIFEPAWRWWEFLRVPVIRSWRSIIVRNRLFTTDWKNRYN